MRRIALVLLIACSCQAQGSSPYTSDSEERRNTALAQELSRTAADLIDSDPEAAEKLLRRALAEDLFYGPAHNNLGVLYLKQEKLYAAASELEWAPKLMPGHPDPRMNLALTLEVAGKYDDAIQSYEAALQVYPGHLQTEQALARLLVSQRREHERLLEMLERVALEGETEAWRVWARGAALRRW